MKPAARELPGMFSQIRKYTVVSECAESPLKIAHDNDVRISGGFPLSIRRGVIYQEMPNNYYCLAHITHRWSTTTTAAAAATAVTPPPLFLSVSSFRRPFAFIAFVDGTFFFSSFFSLFPRLRLSFARASFHKRNARYKHATKVS